MLSVAAIVCVLCCHRLHALLPSFARVASVVCACCCHRLRASLPSSAPSLPLPVRVASVVCACHFYHLQASLSWSSRIASVALARCCRCLRALLPLPERRCHRLCASLQLSACVAVIERRCHRLRASLPPSACVAAIVCVSRFCCLRASPPSTVFVRLPGVMRVRDLNSND